MQAIDHIHLFFRKDAPSHFDRESLAMYSGLDGDEVEAVISTGSVTPATVTRDHLNACRAVTFGLDAGLDLEASLQAVEAPSLSDDEYRRCLVVLAGKAAPEALILRGVEFLEAVQAIATAGRCCGMVAPHSIAA